MSAAELSRVNASLASRYRLMRPLGVGGMGAVYLAQELALDRPVALKVLPAAFATDDVLRERFLQETRTTAAFAHPNIVPVYGVEAHPELLAFAMAYVDGESLAERVARAGPLNARALVRLMHDVSYALAYAHGRGIVHRDIKPDNIMLERATSRALVMDFGIARPVSAAANGRDGLTRVGEVVGTPEYMSPEQACGESVDGRSDLYSLGLVLWFAATGQTAMGGESTQRVLARQLSETLPPISSVRSDLPKALAEAIDRCVAKDASARFADAGALAAALDDAELAAPEVPVPIRAVATELRTLGLVAVIGTALAAFLANRTADKGWSVADQWIPLVFFGALILARAIQALGEVARLGRLGFDAAAVLRSLRAILDEAKSARTAAALDPVVRADRRRELFTAAVMLGIAAASLLGAVALRRPLGAPGAYDVPPLGIAFFFNMLACVAVAAVLVARSPFRANLGERAFRAVWLGPVGRALLRRVLRNGVSGHRGVRTSRSTTSPVVSPMPSSVSVVANGHAGTRGVASAETMARLSQLEARVAALEERANAG